MRHRRPPLLLALALAVPAMAFADRPLPPVPLPPPRPVQPTPTPGPSCLGRWQGASRGSAGPPWTIDMLVTAEEGPRCGTIEYPSLGCGGYLVDCHRRGDVVTWTEVYTHNPGTCAPAGRIDARCEPDSMSWTWTGQEVTSTTLRRAVAGALPLR